ncbi:hypothetical protein [Paenibacillus alvei]|uniref:hypothetical protein n=1 Tax=Paenibacillus alvei TaxID=44250 RepID=UPI0018CD307A|nr:hypothetical protein [Paenibacillus alvei]MCY9579550.1 hypothetical protein [Paenibacillus alvei]MCY9586510.1 hypothetical protein [Paenibacillus alvei]
MEKYRFFNSTPDDRREYLASDFAEYFARFLSDGLYSENGNVGLRVAPGAGLGVNVLSGYAFVRGYMYHNDAELPKTLAASDTMLDRIDRVILRWDEPARKINIVIKKGDFSSTPVVPGLEITKNVKELAIAQVRIRKGATSITASDITDERLTAACGLVSSLIDIPVQEMWNVWNGSLSQIKDAWDKWFGSVQNKNGLRVMIGPTEPADIVAGDLWLKVM